LRDVVAEVRLLGPAEVVAVLRLLLERGLGVAAVGKATWTGVSGEHLEIAEAALEGGLEASYQEWPSAP